MREANERVRERRAGADCLESRRYISFLRLLFVVAIVCEWMKIIIVEPLLKMIWKLCQLIWQFYDVLTIWSHDTHQSYSHRINRFCCHFACHWVHLFWIYLIVLNPLKLNVTRSRFYLCLLFCLWMESRGTAQYTLDASVDCARFGLWESSIFIATTRSLCHFSFNNNSLHSFFIVFDIFLYCYHRTSTSSI